MRDRTEDRLRDALTALRDQSRPPAGGYEEVRAGVRPLVDIPSVTPARRRRPRLLVGLAAAACLVILTLALGGGSDDGTVETRPAHEPISHAELIERAVAECRAFQAAAPSAAAPFNQGVEPLRRWYLQYDAALEGTADVFVDVVAVEDDVELLDDVRRLLGQQRAAAIRAGQALDDGDEFRASEEIDRSLRYGDQVAFMLAEAGAEECDPRGVTRATR